MLLLNEVLAVGELLEADTVVVLVVLVVLAVLVVVGVFEAVPAIKLRGALEDTIVGADESSPIIDTDAVGEAMLL